MFKAEDEEKPLPQMESAKGTSSEIHSLASVLFLKPQGCHFAFCPQPGCPPCQDNPLLWWSELSLSYVPTPQDAVPFWRKSQNWMEVTTVGWHYSNPMALSLLMVISVDSLVWFPAQLLQLFHVPLRVGMAGDRFSIRQTWLWFLALDL